MLVENKDGETIAPQSAHSPMGQIRWQAHAKTDSNSIIRLGFWSVGILMVVFAFWALFFPLSSAVITPGTFASQGKNKLIQHATGGRVQKIFVRDGDMLEQGQPILELDRAQSQAEFTRLQARHASLSALRLRLDAERSGGLRQMVMPPIILENDPTNDDVKTTGATKAQTLSLRGNGGRSFVVVKAQKTKAKQSGEGTPALFKGRDELLNSQRDAYLSGQKLLQHEIKSLENKAETLRKQKEGLIVRGQAKQTLLSMAQREFKRLKPLVSAGYVARNRLNDRERTVLELQGAVTALELDVLGVDTQIDEIRILMGKARAQTSDAASKQYTKIIGEMAEISDQLKAARAAVTNSVVRAPVSGTLLKLATSTIGGIVGAGENIGEIVPHGTPLVVQARVLPGDIDYVQIGQQAKIAVTAFNRRIDDTLEGRVVYKSADASQDEKTGDPYFTVRLELLGETGTGRSRIKDVQAGMQSEIYIQTGSRTFMTYLAKPMIDSFRRAFREQ